MRTVDGVTYNIYREAAIALNLATTDTELLNTLEEASSSMMPRKLRQFFVYLLLCYDHVDGALLWDKFKTYLSEDQRGDNSTKCNKALCLIGAY